MRMLARKFLCNVNDTRALIGLCLLVTSGIGQIRELWHSQAFSMRHIVIGLSLNIHSFTYTIVINTSKHKHLKSIINITLRIETQLMNGKISMGNIYQIHAQNMKLVLLFISDISRTMRKYQRLCVIHVLSKSSNLDQELVFR